MPSVPLLVLAVTRVGGQGRRRLVRAAPALGAARATIAVFAAFGLTLAVWGTASRSIRAAPSPDELDDAAPR